MGASPRGRRPSSTGLVDTDGELLVTLRAISSSIDDDPVVLPTITYPSADDHLPVRRRSLTCPPTITYLSADDHLPVRPPTTYPSTDGDLVSPELARYG
jgi:hypothetical protein